LSVIPRDLLQQYEPIIAFIRNADVLIHEAQYPNDEYAKKIGWGHTGLSNACLLAKLGSVKRWIVTHHDPIHDDSLLEEKLLLTRQILETIDYAIPVTHAFDGLTEVF
ncbi:MAG: phytochrome sensor protein, partial [Ignavibacteriales bacterium]|nr:phytochrome sensor protein [Ignavibacteriales bacterium]